MKPALFLDRDGTINRSDVRDGRPYAPTRAEDFQILPGVAETIANVKEAGFPVIVITNQPDISTGKQSVEILDAMHARLTEELGIDDIFVCPHVDNHHCDCRKPRPGLILAAAQKWDVDCSRSIMAGDRWRDVDAGRAAGCATVFIDHGYAEDQPERVDIVVSSLADAEGFIMRFLCKNATSDR